MPPVIPPVGPPMQLTLFDNGCDPSQPLPLLVACLFDFDLPTETIKGQIVYRLHSWFSGMVNKKYANQAIRDLRRNGWFDQCVYAVHTLQEADSRNRSTERPWPPVAEARCTEW